MSNAAAPQADGDDEAAQDQKDLAMVMAHVSMLKKRFDTVHVFVTRHSGETTGALSRGAGNWYGRYGQIHEWMAKQDENARIEKRSENQD